MRGIIVKNKHATSSCNSTVVRYVLRKGIPGITPTFRDMQTATAPAVLVSTAAVLWDVTQWSPKERCVTSQITATEGTTAVRAAVKT